MAASPEQVDAFLASMVFDRYQSVPLPHGRRTPGRDVSGRAESIMRGRVEGKSVLDVGTYYGAFPYEAVRLGAKGVVGVEPHADRANVAKKVSALHGGQYDIVHAGVETLEFDEGFDVVLFLNVIHHVADPVGVITRLSSVCRETMIIEFPSLTNLPFLRRLAASSSEKRSATSRAAQRMRVFLLARLLRLAERYVPLVGVGNKPYYNTYYFSPAAFQHMFVTHSRLFSRIEFTSSPENGRVLAICTMASASTRNAGARGTPGSRNSHAKESGASQGQIAQ